MGILRDYFETRAAVVSLRRAHAQLRQWQRQAAGIVDKLRQATHPTTVEFQLPTLVQNLPEEARDAQVYIEETLPRMERQEEILQDKVIPLYEGTEVLERILVRIPRVLKALSELHGLLNLMQQYSPLHEQMKAHFDDLPNAVKKAVLAFDALQTYKWADLLKNLQALEALSSRTPMLHNRSGRGDFLLRQLDPFWHNVFSVNAGDEEWDEDEPVELPDEDYEESPDEVVAHGYTPKGRPLDFPLEDDDDDEDDEEEDEEDGVGWSDEDEEEDDEDEEEEAPPPPPPSKKISPRRFSRLKRKKGSSL